MILADTSIWVDHFRVGDRTLQKELLQNGVATHPFVIGELSLGSLPQRAKTLAYLQRLPLLKMARFDEVLHLVETQGLYRRGIGWIDAHLIAATLIQPPARLWTRDKRLRAVAEEFGVHAGLA